MDNSIIDQDNSLKSFINEIGDVYKKKMGSNLNTFLSGFNTKLNILSICTCFITLIILVLLVIVNNFFASVDIFYNIIQYISISIFFFIMLTYYILYKNTKN